MRILLIISQYSPAQTPNTLRWVPLVEYLRAQGYEVIILTTCRNGESLEETTNENIKIYRAGYNTLLDRLYDLLDSKKRRHEVGSGPTQPGILTRLVQAIVSSTWRKYYWPDGTQLFLKPGIKQVKQIVVKEKITHVISVGLPFTCHLIAQAAKVARPNLHWHMDIQDPFCYSKDFRVNNHEKYEQKNIDAERQAFKDADTISITNERAKENYKALFPYSAKKISVIPPLFSLPRESETYNMYLYSGKVHLTYFGSFYEGVRSPLPFFNFIKYIWDKDKTLLSKFQFHFVGQLHGEAYALFDKYPEIRRCFVIHGFKNRAETLDAMEQTTILMNFGNTTDYHLPSKVVDYLYINKPILNFTSIKDDSTQLFFKETSADCCTLWLDSQHYESMLEQFLAFTLKPYPKTAPDYNLVQPYAVKQIAAAYTQALSKEGHGT